MPDAVQTIPGTEEGYVLLGDLVTDVCHVLDWPRPAAESEDEARIVAVLDHVGQMVKAYTRDRGTAKFDTFGDAFAGSLSQVVVSATARALLSPAGAKRVEIGTTSVVGTPLTGWTLAELRVLDRYRVRTA